MIGGAAALEAREPGPAVRRRTRRSRDRVAVRLRYGGYTGRKNVGLLLDAWPRVGRQRRLSSPGRRSRRATTAAATRSGRSVGRRSRLCPVGTTCPSIASGPRPSRRRRLYEGFGFPPLEALAAGTPVVALASPFVQEICGDAALLVGNDPSELAAAIGCVRVDHELAEHLGREGLERACSFSWRATAERVLTAYADAAVRS